MSLRAATTWSLLIFAAAPDISGPRPRTAWFLTHVVAEGELVTRLVGVDLTRRALVAVRDTADTFEVRVPRVGPVLFFPHGRDGLVECLNARSGRLLWSERVPPFRVLRPLDPNTWLIAGRTNEVALMRRRDADDARRVWVTRTADEPRDVVPAGDRLVVPTYSRIYCLSAQDGGVLWVRRPPGAACLYATLVGDRVVTWDWWGGRLEALSMADGKPVWSREMVRPWAVGAHRGRLLVTSGGSGELEGIGAADGRPAWRAAGLLPQIALPPTADIGYMPFVGPSLPSGARSSAGRGVFVTIDRGRAVELDLATGEVRRELAAPLEGRVVGAADAGGGTVCFAFPERLVFVGASRSWSLPMSEPLHHLRGIDRWDH